MTTARVPLPDGRVVVALRTPRTYLVEDRLRSVILEEEVGATVGFHRERPLFQALRTTALSVATSTMTPVPLDTELIDTHDGHGDTTNTSRWIPAGTFATTNWYLVNGHIPFAGAAGGVRIAGVRFNAGTVAEGMKIPGSTAHQVGVQVIDLVESASFDDYIELMAYQTTGAPLSTIASGKTPSLTARWVCGSGPVVALPSPRTWTAADLISADSTVGGRIPLNVHIRDVIQFLKAPPIARLTSEGTAQTIPTGSGTWTSIQLPTETVDNYGGHDPVTNNSRYIAQRAGVHYFAGLASVGEPGANSGYRACRLLHTIAAGGTAIYQGTPTIPAASGTTGTAIYATAPIRMAVGDYVELQMQQTQGAALSVAAGAGPCSKLIAVWRSL